MIERQELHYSGESEMRALTVKQPWAELIARGEKRIENRKWRSHLLKPGELFLLHVGLEVDDYALEFFVKEGRFGLDHETEERMWSHRGHIIAVLRLLNYHESSTTIESEQAQRWYEEGLVGWEVEVVERLVPPLRCSGGQGLWQASLEVSSAVGGKDE